MPRPEELDFLVSRARGTQFEAHCAEQAAIVIHDPTSIDLAVVSRICAELLLERALELRLDLETEDEEEEIEAAAG